MQLTFQKSSLLRKSFCEDHRGLQNPFVSLTLLLPYLLHIVILSKELTCADTYVRLVCSIK